MKEYNVESLQKLENQVPGIVEANPHFFDDGVMDLFGYQKFDIVTNGVKNYLTVNRSIVRNNLKVDLNTSVYELDETSKIVRLAGSIRKKIRSILPVKSK